MKKRILVSALMSALMVAGLVSNSSAMLLCDSYGKTWDVSISGTTLEGVRDIDDQLGCGGLYVRGMFGGSPAHFVMTSMEGNGNCVAVIWDGVWQFDSGSGTWYNNNGLGTGPFTLTAGPCASRAADADDPAQP